MVEEKPASVNETKEKVEKLLVKWKSKRGSLIMALHEIQGVFGFVPWSAVEIVSRELNIPVSQIYAVLTFYNYFKLSAPGKVIISLCDGTACHIKGAPSLIDAIYNCLGIKDGETTADGVFHLQIVRCLGCCGLAPVVVVNGKTYRKVVPADIPKIIAEWRSSITKK